MHDRYWASRHVGVVRPGQPVPDRGPSLYLLLDKDEIVLFDLKPVVRHLSRIKPRALRIRVRDDHTTSYAETVDADESGRFIAIRRSYRASMRTLTHAWLTPDRRVAAAWAQGQTRRQSLAALRALVPTDRIASFPTMGRVLDPKESGEHEEAQRALLERWRAPVTLIEDIYEYEPGVWVHDEVIIPEGARLIGPLWIGAGATIAATDVLVGPAFIADGPGKHPPVGDIDWSSLRIPEYRIMPQLPRRKFGRIVKRAFDVFFSLFVLLCTLPIYPVIILLIYIEDGWPPFFAHYRQTIHGRRFPCYKFRTMCRNAEELKTRLVAANVCDGPQFFIQNDPRLLKVGKYLRKFQLDELPQFWNVLLGHMSVVGPRPSPDKENQYCPAWREARLSVRPGITGLWQVQRTRAPSTDFQEWIRYDLEYVQRASLKLDLWIILQTVRRIFTG